MRFDFDCRECGRELPMSEVGRDDTCGVTAALVCKFCDNCDEAFSELLEPEVDAEPMRVHQMRAAGGGFWVTRSGCKGKRMAFALETVAFLWGCGAVHPHDWPYAKWPGGRGMFMPPTDRVHLT